MQLSIRFRKILRCVRLFSSHQIQDLSGDRKGFDLIQHRASNIVKNVRTFCTHQFKYITII